MRRRLLATAFVVGSSISAGLAPAGCAGHDLAETGESAQALFGTQPPSEAEACSDDVLFGVTSVGSCPNPVGSNFGTWTVAPVFPGANEPLLARHCRYKWTSSNGALPDMAALPAMGASPPADWLDPDCRVVAPLATIADVRDQTRLAMAEHARNQNAAITLPTGKLPRAAVRVLVVDTSPTSPAASPLPVLGRNEHGYAMARLAQDVACTSGASCPVSVLTQLGLPRVKEDEVDLLNGGHFGTMEDVASAIAAGVRSWRSVPPNARPRLVINLSIGWSGEFDGPATNPKQILGMRGSVRAVFDAMVYASCSGAVMIAAAGNDGGGLLRPTGAMFPAGWEALPSPTVAQCLQALGPGFAGWDGTGYAPLVYATGAVDAQDERVVNARAGGMPRLAAAGQAVVARVPAGVPEGLPGGVVATTGSARGTAPRTGSSVAAAAVSGAAAAVWSYAPALAREDMMALVYGAGPVIDGAADFCHGDPCAPVRRLDVCQSVAAACALAPGRCAAPPVCAGVPAYGGARFVLPPALRDAAALAFSASPTTAVSIDLAAPVDESAVCGGLSYGHAGFDLGTYPCIDRQFHADAAVPFALPQPGSWGDPDFPVIVFDGSWNATMMVSRTAERAYSLQGTTVIITSGSGERTVYGVGGDLGAGTSTMRYQFAVHPPVGGVADVTAAFVTAGARSTVVVAPVIVGTR